VKRNHRTLLTATACASALAAVALTTRVSMGAQSASRDFSKELANKTTGRYVVAIVGDVLLQDPLAIGKQASADIQKILRDANTSIAGVEGTPAGNPLASRPVTLVAQDLADLGLDLAAPAEPAAATALTPLGIGSAATACQAAVQYLPQGRIALIPGSDPMRATADKIVTREQLVQLKAIRDAIVARRTEPDVSRPIATPVDEPDRVAIFGNTYVAGPEPGDTKFEMSAPARQANVAAVRSAKEFADFAILTMRPTRDVGVHVATDHAAPQHLRDLAHEAIDNGADLYVGLGQHLVQGVEIYKGRPVLYGLGDLSVHRLGATELPESSHVAVLATATYQDGILQEVRLYPIDLGIDKTQRAASKTGVAMTPSPAVAAKILGDLQTYSKALGTTIAIENGVGVIRVARDATTAIGQGVRAFGAAPEAGCGGGGRGGRGGRGRGGEAP